MTQEDKELLLADLSARLPYKPKIWFTESDSNDQLQSIWYDNLEGWQVDGDNLSTPIYAVKPYLFPLSVMTKEQEEEWDDLYIKPLCERLNPHTRKEDLMLRAKAGYAATFWLIKNHFDYLGLIPLGLAIDATNLNIY